MATGKDDTTLWLHNKLGSQNHMWSSATIATQYTNDKLASIKDCFNNLDSLVKMRFFLSLLHISKRNMDDVSVFISQSLSYSDPFALHRVFIPD